MSYGDLALSLNNFMSACTRSPVILPQLAGRENFSCESVVFFVFLPVGGAIELVKLALLNVIIIILLIFFSPLGQTLMPNFGEVFNKIKGV